MFQLVGIFGPVGDLKYPTDQYVIIFIHRFAFVALPQLLLDGLELLPQVILPLALGNLLLRHGLDFLADLDLLQGLLQEPDRRLETLQGRDGHQDLFLVLELEVQVVGDLIGQAARSREVVPDEVQDLLR